MTTRFNRITLVVLDGAGIGAMPDAPAWGDAGSDTFGHICESRQLSLPNLQSIGLGNIRPLSGVPASESPRGGFGKCALQSNGKDTTTGHWEMAGIILEQAVPLYPNGFPAEIIERFIEETGVPGVLGNFPASGTEIIKELGEEHVKTGRPIVYTSGDSVFQIAAHEEVVPITELYRMCEIARKLLDGPHRVGRVIARPFAGTPGNFVRTTRRHDYAVDPPKPMLMDVLAERKVRVFGVGKIHDIYNGRGVQEYVTTKGNADGMEKLTAAVSERESGLIFCNLVDFDMLYGHRKDVEGFAKSLEEFDRMLADFLPLLSLSDLLMITADHGCDPDARWPTTDHSREYVPILAYSPGGGAGVDLGVRNTLADMGQTVAENFGCAIPHGKSFLSKMKMRRTNEVAG